MCHGTHSCFSFVLGPQVDDSTASLFSINNIHIVVITMSRKTVSEISSLLRTPPETRLTRAAGARWHPRPDPGPSEAGISWWRVSAVMRRMTENEEQLQ